MVRDMRSQAGKAASMIEIGQIDRFLGKHKWEIAMENWRSKRSPMRRDNVEIQTDYDG